MRVYRSARGDGCNPSFASLDRMNVSIGWTLTTGEVARCGGRKAQCFSHPAPCLIHSSMSDASAADTVAPVCAGGMRRVLSSLRIRCNRTLAAGSPGTIARRPPPRSAFAVSSRSSRRRMPLAVASAAWQAKQRSERMGRMSRLNDTGSACKPVGIAVKSPAKRKIRTAFIRSLLYLREGREAPTKGLARRPDDP